VWRANESAWNNANNAMEYNQVRWRHSQRESVGASGGTPWNYMLGKSSE